ncbi:MAG: hypothetical protein ACK5NF_02400 [Bacilli bacterium]
MKKKYFVFIIFLTLVSAFAFTRVINDLYIYEFLEKSGIDSVTFYPSSGSGTNIADNKDEFINTLDEHDAMISTYNYTENKLIFEYYNINNKGKTSIDKYNKVCTIDCIEFLELKKENISFDNGIQVKSRDNLQLINEVDKIGIDLEYNIGESTTLNMKISNFLQVYSLYAKIFLLIVMCFVTLTLIQIIKDLKEVRLQSLFGYKFNTIWYNSNKKIFINIYLVYMLLTPLIAYVGFKSLMNSIYVAIITFIMVILSWIISSIILFFVYTCISKRMLSLISKNIVYVTSIVLIVISLFVIDATSTVLSNIEIKSLLSNNNEYLSNYYMPKHNTNISVDENEKVFNYLIENDLAEYYNLHTEEVNNFSKTKKYGYVLEVDKNFFKRNPQITLSNGKKINYSKIYEKHILNNKLSKEKMQEMRDGIFENANLSDEEINNLTTTNLIFKKKSVDIEKNIFVYDNYNEGSFIQILDDNRDYHTFVLDIEDMKLNNFAIYVRNEPDFLSNLYIKADSSYKAQNILREVYSKYDINVKADVKSAGNEVVSNNANIDVKASLIACSIGVIILICTLLLYVELLFIKYKSSIITASLYGFKNKIIFKDILVEFLVVNMCVLLVLLLFMYSLTSIIIWILLLLLEYIIIITTGKKLVKLKLVEYIKGELNGY